MNRTRAADDFATIKARMEELLHPRRAADDFATIRARIEELRREREGKPREEVQRDPPLPRGGSIRWPPSEIGEGPGRVRQSGPIRRYAESGISRFRRNTLTQHLGPSWSRGFSAGAAVGIFASVSASMDHDATASGTNGLSRVRAQ